MFLLILQSHFVYIKNIIKIYNINNNMFSILIIIFSFNFINYFINNINYNKNNNIYKTNNNIYNPKI
jgi:hypothetical protein